MDKNRTLNLKGSDPLNYKRLLNSYSFMSMLNPWKAETILKICLPVTEEPDNFLAQGCILFILGIIWIEKVCWLWNLSDFHRPQHLSSVITSLWEVLRGEGNVIFPVDTRYESYKVNKTSASAILSTMLVYQRSRLTTRPFLYKIGWRRTNRIVN